MSAPMVRALLAGTKTQTRRIVKHRYAGTASVVGDCLAFLDNGRRTGPDQRCPYGVPGDRLWVRETWHTSPHFECLYRADYDHNLPLRKVVAHGGWRPSIYMPRWASRITLEITDVRVQRLQEISDSDAFAEGIQQVTNEGIRSDGTARGTYRALWEYINGPGSWDANPWAWVLTFYRVQP